jgi:hypothetical protein
MLIAATLAERRRGTGRASRRGRFWDVQLDRWNNTSQRYDTKRPTCEMFHDSTYHLRWTITSRAVVMLPLKLCSLASQRSNLDLLSMFCSE